MELYNPLYFDTILIEQNIIYLTEGLENNCGSKSVKAFNELFRRCEVDK